MLRDPGVTGSYSAHERTSWRRSLARRVAPAVLCASSLAVGLNAWGQLGAQKKPTSLVEVRVILANTDTPLPGTDVQIRNRVGGVFTDSLGLARLFDVPAGRLTIDVRRLGFYPASASVTASGGDTITLTLELKSTAQALAKVNIKDTAVHWTLGEFEERRRRGNGHFITQAQIESERGTTFDALIGRHFGPVRYDNGQIYTTKYGPLPPCPLVVFIDGLRSPNGLIEPLDPQHLGGVELYSSNQVPPQYRLGDAEPGFQPPRRSAGPKPMRGGLRCGVMLIWSRP